MYDRLPRCEKSEMRKIECYHCIHNLVNLPIMEFDDPDT